MMSMSSARSALSQSGISARPYVSKVGILPSSLPAYHKDFMERKKAGGDHDEAAASALHEEPTSSRTDAEKEEAARRLKPHTRSQLRIDEAAKRPQGMTPMNPAKKSRPVRWQFGIRSRNAPWEALLCIHKALYKLGATYIPDEDYAQVPHKGGEASSGDGSFGDDYDGPPPGHDTSADLDPAKRYKLPADPWHIKVRWESASMSPPPFTASKRALTGVCAKISSARHRARRSTLMSASPAHRKAITSFPHRIPSRRPLWRYT